MTACSWDEMAKYDLPAMIDFVLKTSGVPKLFYIGHSQGTLMAFAHASRNASFANKVLAGLTCNELLLLRYFT